MASAYYHYISKKQIGVIFAAVKRGDIYLNDTQISYMYRHFSEVRGFNNNNNFQDILLEVKCCINAIFEKDYEEAQQCINRAFSKECSFFNSEEIRKLKESMLAEVNV